MELRFLTAMLAFGICAFAVFSVWQNATEEQARIAYADAPVLGDAPVGYLPAATPLAAD